MGNYFRVFLTNNDILSMLRQTEKRIAVSQRRTSAMGDLRDETASNKHFPFSFALPITRFLSRKVGEKVKEKRKRRTRSSSLETHLLLSARHSSPHLRKLRLTRVLSSFRGSRGGWWPLCSTAVMPAPDPWCPLWDPLCLRPPLDIDFGLPAWW